MRGFNDDEMCDFVNLTRDKPINIRFIEFMPFQWKCLEFQETCAVLGDVGYSGKVQLL